MSPVVLSRAVFMVIQWAHYQRNKPTQSKRRTKVFISEPDPNLRHRYGRLFGIIELHSLHASHLRFLHAFVETLERAYYPNGTGTHGPQQPVSTHFENMLKQLNSRVAHLATDHGIPMDDDQFSFLIGVLKERDLVFTHRGKTRAFLLHYDERRPPKLVDIVAVSERDTRETDTFFPSLLEGQLGPHDRVLISTEALTDYLAPAQLEEILATHGAREAVERLETILEEAPAHLAFPLLVIELEPESSAQRKSAASVQKLIDTERATKDILAPSFTHDIRRIAHAIGAQIMSWLPGAQRHGAPSATLELHPPTQESALTKERLRAVGHMTWKVLRIGVTTITKVIITATILIARFAQWFVRMLMSRRSGESRSTTNDQTTQGDTWAAWYRALGLSHRIPLLIGGTLLIIFIGSLGVLSYKRTSAQRTTATLQLVKTIEEKQAQLEVNIIYRDEERARNVLSEIESLLATFPTRRGDRTTKEGLERKLVVLRARLEKRVILDTPERLIDLAQFTPRDRTFTPRAFIFQNNNMYVYGDTPLLFKVNEENRQAISFEIPQTTVGSITAAMPYKSDTILFIDADNKLVELNPEARTLKPIDVIFGGDQPKLRAGAVYNDRLYVVDGHNHQIYRHPALPTGFGKGIPWLKESLDLSDVSALHIDGTLWVLFNDGSLTHLVQGTRRAFAPDTMVPPLARATRIATTFESDYLTILDPQERRLVVLRKRDGKLAMQYTSPVFTDLKDFIIDETKKTMYILNGTSIYTVPLQHL